MNQIFVILAIIIILAAFYIYLPRKNKVGKKQQALRRECQMKLRLSPKLAEETIERFIQRLKEKYPNRSEEWYLEKILYDLERDRK